MPKKIYALFPEERERECDHPSGFTYRAAGGMPCTGPKICRMCGSFEEDILAQGPSGPNSATEEPSCT